MDYLKKDDNLPLKKNRTNDFPHPGFSSDDMGGPLGVGSDEFSDPELNRGDEFPRPNISDTDTGGLRTPDLGTGSTPNFYLEGRTDLGLDTPGGKYRFAIEPTPRRTAEDSITRDTLRVLSKLREVMTDKDSVMFDEVFGSFSRQRAAAAFYQLLVLKSTKSINLDQKEPFGPIKVTPTEQFWATTP